jgi:lysozyme
MKVSPQGIALICRFEGCKLEAYPDASPQRILTIGYGHTGASVMPGQTISLDRAKELLAGDLVRFEDVVTHAVTVPLTQGQFDACVSFAYNCGPQNFRSSILLCKLNDRDYVGTGQEFGRWVHAGAETLPGLVLRRSAERAMFES